MDSIDRANPYLQTVSWAQLSRLFPEDGDGVQSPKLFFLVIKTRMMDNVQKVSNCIDVPSSQTFRSCNSVFLSSSNPTVVNQFSSFIHFMCSSQLSEIAVLICAIM
jgi:hypothetical protein